MRFISSSRIVHSLAVGQWHPPIGIFVTRTGLVLDPPFPHRIHQIR